MGTHVSDVMTTRPRAVTPDTPVTQVAELMREEDVGAIPVVQDDQLVGMVTDRDIVVRAVANGELNRPVREVVSGNVVTARPDMSTKEAAKLMSEYQVRRLPVVDRDNHLIGVVSQADVAREAKEKAAGEMLEDISRGPSGPRTT